MELTLKRAREVHAELLAISNSEVRQMRSLLESNLVAIEFVIESEAKGGMTAEKAEPSKSSPRNFANTCVSDHGRTQTMIEDCEARESRLSDYERSFIDSIKRQLADGRTLSKKQAEVLDDVWNRPLRGMTMDELNELQQQLLIILKGSKARKLHGMRGPASWGIRPTPAAAGSMSDVVAIRGASSN